MTVLGTVPSIVKTWRSTRCMEGLDWTKLKYNSHCLVHNPKIQKKLVLTIVIQLDLQIFSGHWRLPVKHLMLMMTFGFLQGLTTNLSLNVVAVLSSHLLTSKGMFCNHKRLERLALLQWQQDSSFLMTMEFLTYVRFMNKIYRLKYYFIL